MTTQSATKLMTAEELLRLGDDVRGELIRGVFCETMSTGEEHGGIVIKLGALLVTFAEPRGLGRVTGSDAGLWLERDPDTVREPDLAFTSAERSPPGVWNKGYAEIVPDLVVEVRSPNDSRREVHDKALMWLSYGVRLVWVVHPDTRTVDVHREGATVVTLAEDAALAATDILPGFTCAVSDIFPK